MVKNPPASAGDKGDAGPVPMSGRFPGGGNGNPLPYSCLENSMDTGAWRATVYGITERWTRLSEHTRTLQNEAEAPNMVVRPIVTGILLSPHLPYCPLHLNTDILLYDQLP